MYHYLDYIPQWKHIASDVGDVIFVKPLVECIIGADLITGEELDGYERGMKLVVAAVDVTGIGLAARAGAGLGVKGVSEVVMIGMTTDALSTVNSDVTQMFVKDMGGSDEAANLAGIAAGWATGAASDKILGNSLYNTVTNVNGINGGMADDLIEGGVRTVNGFDTTVNAGKQGKHIVGHNNYVEGRSIFQSTVDDAQRLVKEFGGTGEWIGTNRERVDFGQIIGQYVNPATGEAVDTTVGIIHYSNTGSHIVPALPKQ